MSEKLHHPSPEHHRAHPEHESREQAERLKHLHEKAEKAEHGPQDNLETIKKSIESAAVSGKEYTKTEKEAPQPTNYGINKELKATAYRKVIKKTQSQLSAPERTFSRTIHNPTIDRVSEVAAKTVARPSGLLFGGIGAFIGTLFVFYISKRAGFTYNYLLFVLLFIGCYVAGVVLEGLLKLVRKAQRR